MCRDGSAERRSGEVENPKDKNGPRFSTMHMNISILLFRRLLYPGCRLKLFTLQMKNLGLQGATSFKELKAFTFYVLNVYQKGFI